MSGTSIQIEGKNVIFQVFCGRWEQANVLEHPREVLRRLAIYDWSALKQQLGITHVYLLGLWNNEGPILVNEERGQDLHFHENRCPSPFAITNHVEVMPSLGTDLDLFGLIEKIHDAGLSVIVDFVPNHTGAAHPWLQSHPEYYKTDETGKPRTAFSGDVYELNYDNPQVVKDMVEIVTTLANSFHIDGVRCDMAHLVPTSFWTAAIEIVRQTHPGFLFIAEAYSSSVFDLTVQQQLFEAGFNAVYDEPLYRNIVMCVGGSIRPLFGHIEYELSQANNYWVHYLSNHDDVVPCNSTLAWQYQQLLFMLPGWQLVYNGTIWGFEGRLAHHWVQLLPKQFTDLVKLDSERTEWLNWFVRESPTIMKFFSLTENEVEVAWQGRTTQGVQRYTFE